MEITVEVRGCAATVKARKQKVSLLSRAKN